MKETNDKHSHTVHKFELELSLKGKAHVKELSMLRTEMEGQRVKYETRIIELEDQIRRYTTTTL
jgi:hypothetical protein